MGNDIMVSESEKLLVRILRGTSDKNIPFEGMCRLLRHIGFEERTRGSHHIFTRDGVEEILNLQTKAGRAKPYQVKQVRQVILKYRLGGREDEQ
jgi:predicted RNA binding protein YcfA (HicA-like mRNA interferase family)